jgi:hypothetical protein
MAKWKELPPSPEAIVRAALESAAEQAKERDAKWMRKTYEVTYAKLRYDLVGVRACENKFANVLSEDIEDAILSLASDPAEVAAIIKKAGGTND